MGIITIFPTSYMTAMSTTAPPSSSAHPRPPLELAKRMQSLQPSATLAMAARASAMKADGIDVIDLSVGEPDFPTPAHICAAGEAAIRAGHTKYTPAAGIPALRKAIAEDASRRTGREVTAAQVIVSNGAKHCLHNVFTALLNEGDEVIVPTPYWVSYAELVKLAGATPVLVETRLEDDFKLRPEAFAAAVTPATRMLLLCSPSNPTGVVYTADELGALADIVLEKNLSVVSDEIYDQLVFDGRTSVSFPTLRPGLEERTVVVAGVSKTYSMTGWRIGWTISPPSLAKAIGSLQSQETSNPSSISQYAAIEALQGPQDCVREMCEAFQKRRDLVAAGLKAMPGVRVPDIGGAFYAFFDISAHLGKAYGGTAVTNSVEWCEALLEAEQVATVAGSAFGAEGHVRMSFAASEEKLTDGLARISRFLASAS
jgi:aspartate aminotransferase